jgi:hypothetical protein
MQTLRPLNKILTTLGLITLGAGFVSLGLVSMMHGRPENPSSNLLSNPACPLIGSVTSILLGVGFFVLAILFMATLLQKERPMKQATANAEREISTVTTSSSRWEA